MLLIALPPAPPTPITVMSGLRSVNFGSCELDAHRCLVIVASFIPPAAGGGCSPLPSAVRGDYSLTPLRPSAAQRCRSSSHNRCHAARAPPARAAKCCCSASPTSPLTVANAGRSMSRQHLRSVRACRSGPSLPRLGPVPVDALELLPPPVSTTLSSAARSSLAASSRSRDQRRNSRDPRLDHSHAARP